MIIALYRLFRLPLAIMNGIAALGGAALFPGEHDTQQLWLICSGVTSLAAGASALNQVIEHNYDRLMKRTRLRPIPGGMMTPAQAAVPGISASILGAFLVGSAGGILPAFLGCATILWYLLVYTSLKRSTPFALLAGALCGTMPPVIGWCSVGGAISDYRIMIMAGIFYLWQIPHFWLLQDRHEQDYHAAGFKLLQRPGGDNGSPKLLSIWMVALVVATMLLPAFGYLNHGTTFLCTLLPLPLLPLALFRQNTTLFSYLTLFPLLLSALLFSKL